MTQSISKLERWEGGFPGEHEFSTLDKLDQPGREDFFAASERLVKHWQGNRFAGLYIYGNPGTGKTLAAVGLARALHDEIGAEVHYRFMPQTESSVGLKDIQLFTRPRDSSYRTTDLSPSSVRSVFPSRYYEGAERNPKSVLVLDDYQPHKQELAAAGIEAAAQFGGLVIITSNYTDPFKILEKPTPSLSADQILQEGVAAQVNPEAMQQAAEARSRQLAEVSESLRSRIAAGFKFIEFTGGDRRQENSFWA